ncbi:MAG: hypothetical protein Q8905_16865, partial [Bacteroidota bacterium]|nr:hypothetical protein [Bacteroidota bacterium]
MKKYNILFFSLLMLLIWGCNDDAFLNREPTDVLSESTVWSNSSAALNVLVDLYDRNNELQRTDR